jgi:hypothetical protein
MGELGRGSFSTYGLFSFLSRDWFVIVPQSMIAQSPIYGKDCKGIEGLVDCEHNVNLSIIPEPSNGPGSLALGLHVDLEVKIMKFYSANCLSCF